MNSSTGNSPRLNSKNNNVKLPPIHIQKNFYQQQILDGNEQDDHQEEIKRPLSNDLSRSSEGDDFVRNNNEDDEEQNDQQKEQEYQSEDEEEEKFEGTGMENYFDFGGDNGGALNNEIGTDMFYASIDMFKLMNEKNVKFQSYDLLTRPPCWKWENNQPDYVEEARPTPQSDPYDSQTLRILSVTWNLHGKLPKLDHLKTLLKAESIHHDVYVIATQECMRSIATSVIAPGKEKWENLLKEYLGDNYIMVSSISLAATHLIVFININLMPIVSQVQSGCIATGIRGVVGNKGGVSISFKLGNTSIICLSCHLAAGQGQVEKRNEDFHTIYNNLVLKTDKQQAVPKNSVQNMPNLQPEYDAIIWLGDLNYRINGVIGAIVHAMSKNMYEVLLNNDQFQFEKKIGRVATNFKEGQIMFAPTYKIMKGQDMYNVSQRIPGWTDRILYFSKNDILQQKSYDSNNELKYSDHRPVFSQFQMKFDFVEGFATVQDSKVLDQMKIQKLIQSPSNESQQSSLSKSSMRSIVKTYNSEDLQKVVVDKRLTEKDFNKSKSKGCSIF